MSMIDFEILAKLGEGAYSSVYKVKRLVDETIYALKKVKLINLSNREIHNAVNEVRILASIRHPNIIGYKEAFYDPPTKSLWYIILYPVSSWSTLMEETSCKKSLTTRKEGLSSSRTKFGIFFSKLWRDWALSMTLRFCTEI